MRKLSAILFVLSIATVGCGDDDTTSEPESETNTDSPLTATIELPAQAQLAGGTGGGQTNAYLCEFAGETDNEVGFTMESGAAPAPCDGGNIFVTFGYDLAEQFYDAEAGATSAGGDERVVEFVSSTSGSINEEPTTPDRIEGIPLTTSVTLETRDWLVTFELSDDVVVVTALEPVS